MKRSNAHHAYSSRRRGAPPIVIFVMLSAALHALLFLFLRIDIESPSDDLLSVRLLDEGPLFVRPATPLAEKTTLEKENEKKKEEEKVEIPSGQIVDIARPENEKNPDSSRFLAKWDSQVPRETRSAFDKDIPVRGKKLQRLALPQEAKVTPPSDELALPGEASERREKVEEQVKKGEIAGFEGDRGELERGAEKKEPGRLSGSDGIDRKGEEPAELRIPARYLPYFWGSDTALVSPSNDYLKDVPEDEETALNAQRFLYADYYNRIKRAVSYHWAPGKVLMVHDPGGNIFGFKDRYTKIEAVIDAHGAVLDIKVILSSGADILDREAIDAFRAAAPFPNPPAPLLRDGRLVMQLGFYVEIR